MAIGDRLNLADKETLDIVNANVVGIGGMVGKTDDPGGTATGGTLMGKINHVISNFLDLRSWVVTYLDAGVSTRESEANASTRYNALAEWLNGLRNTEIAAIASAVSSGGANANGNLSAKLSYIIQQMVNLGQKKLVSKQISFQISAPGTHTILDVSGGGQFEYAQTSLPYNADVLVIECDGIAHRFTGKYGTCIVGRFMSYPMEHLTCVTSDTFNNVNYLVWQPFHFKDRLRVWVEKGSSSEGTFYAHYSLYE